MFVHLAALSTRTQALLSLRGPSLDFYFQPVTVELKHAALRNTFRAQVKSKLGRFQRTRSASVDS